VGVAWDFENYFTGSSTEKVLVDTIIAAMSKRYNFVYFAAG
jgi:hypothetical protein